MKGEGAMNKITLCVVIDACREELFELFGFQHHQITNTLGNGNTTKLQLS